MNRVAALGILALFLAACPQRGRHREERLERPAVVVTPRVLTVVLEDGATVEVGADLAVLEPMRAQRPAIVLIPGAGNASRRGTQPGDGARLYERPVEVTALWQRAAAERGFLALAFDKRTCAPSDDPRCRRAPADDFDARGPAALARDIDAACALLDDDPRFDGRLVLFAHGQGVSPSLVSSCARRAAALVLVAPIPRRVDRVRIDALRQREARLRAEAAKERDKAAAERLLSAAQDLKNRAASLEETHASMERGAFHDGARVQGATLAFWRGWIALTDALPAQLGALSTPRLVVLGAEDVQFGASDRKAILGLEKLPGVRVLLVEGADHHLLTGEALLSSTTDRVLDAVEEALRAPAL